MGRCKDCGACGFVKKVRFNTEYCVFLCEDCEKEREKDEN